MSLQVPVHGAPKISLLNLPSDCLQNSFDQMTHPGLQAFLLVFYCYHMMPSLQEINLLFIKWPESIEHLLHSFVLHKAEYSHSPIPTRLWWPTTKTSTSLNFHIIETIIVFEEFKALECSSIFTLSFCYHLCVLCEYSNLHE